MNKKSSRIVFVGVLVVLGLAGPMSVFAAGPATVNLGTAGNFVILSKTGISTTGATSVVGDMGISPAEASYITGFGLILPSASAFSTSALVNGKIYAPGYALPTPTTVTTAVADMQTAYTDAAGRTNPTATELGAGNIGGLTIAPGLYKWGTGVAISSDVTLSGGANDVWIFQIAQNLNVSSAVKVLLSGGAQASNIFWVVAGQTTIGTTAVMQGNILDQTAIVLNTGASLTGRALAQTAVTLDANSVTMPSAAASVPATTVTQTPTVTTTTSTSGSTQTSSSAGTGGQTTTTTQGSSSGASASTSSVDPKIALQSRLNELLATLQTLQAKGNATPNANAVANANVKASFKRNLTVGVSGDDVKALQVWLNANGYVVAVSGPGSTGNETTTFGGLTKKALAKFQAKVGISPAVGYFGPITQQYISTHY